MVWWRDQGTDVWIQLAGEFRSAKFIVTWLKFTLEWDSVHAFVLQHAPHLSHLSDVKLLQRFLSHYPTPIPLKGDAELYIHQSSSNSIIANMRNAKFLCGLANLRKDFGRHACPGGQTDWYLHASVNAFNCCIVGEEWVLRHLPQYRYSVGGSVGGMGTPSKVIVTWPNLP